MDNNTNNGENNNNNNNNNNNSNGGGAGIVSMENLNNVASWFSATVISAFFSSLERFSCVNVATADHDDDDDDEANERPLALSSNSHYSDDPVANLPV